MAKYKTGDTLAAPEGAELPFLMPTQRVVDTMQLIYDEFKAYGYTLTKAEIFDFLEESNILGEAYADLVARVETDTDATDFNAKPFALKVEDIRQDFQRLKSLAVAGAVELTAGQKASLDIIGGVVSIDMTKKRALWPLVLTSDEADILNTAYSFVTSAKNLKQIFPGVSVDITGVSYIHNRTYDGLEVCDGELFDYLARSHSFTEAAPEADEEGEAETPGAEG